MRAPYRSIPVVCLSVLLLGLSSRGGGSIESGPTYRISITNSMPHPVDYSYAAGASTAGHPLGTVDSYGTGLFRIDSPARTTITVIGVADLFMPGMSANVQVTLKPDTLVDASPTSWTR